MNTRPRNFLGAGGGPVGTGAPPLSIYGGIRADTRPRRRAGVASRRNSALFPTVFLPVLPLFPHGFPAVARVAQALVIGRVDEQRPVALVILDVVHIGGPDTQAPPGAFPAERLPQELSGPEVILPDRQVVPAVPRRTLPAGCRLGLVGRAPALPGQCRAAWVPAWPQRFARHGLSPPRSSGKTKKPRPTTAHLSASHWP